MTHFTDVLGNRAQVWCLRGIWPLQFLPEGRCPKSELLCWTIKPHIKGLRLLSFTFMVTFLQSFRIALKVNTCKPDNKTLYINMKNLKIIYQVFICKALRENENLCLTMPPNTDQTQSKCTLLHSFYDSPAFHDNISQMIFI